MPQNMLIKTLACACLSTALTAGTALAQTEVKIVLTNDLYDYKAVAGLSGVIDAQRAAHPNVLVLHAGDALSPSTLSGFDKGAHMIDLLNAIGLDALAPGNHEFDFGAEAFAMNIEQAEFPLISANLKTANGDAYPGITDNLIYDFDGFKIGVYGLMTPLALELTTMGDDASVLELETVAREQQQALKEQGADLVIALSHTDIDEDFALFRAGIADVILTGHDHHEMTYALGDMVMMESGEDADVVMVLTITFEKDGDDVEWRKGIEILDPADYTANVSVAEKIAQLDSEIEARFSEVIGTTASAMNTTRPYIRQKETAFGNMLADAMRAAVNADVALTNGGGIRAKKEYAAGSQITAGDIFKELPFGNVTVMLELSGAQLLAALENGVSQYESVAGRWPQVSNMSFDIDTAAQAGSRVSNVKIAGQDIDMNAFYSVATNDYMASGGDGYDMLPSAKVLSNVEKGTLMATQLIDYIKAKGTINPVVEGRMTIK